VIFPPLGQTDFTATNKHYFSFFDVFPYSINEMPLPLLIFLYYLQHLFALATLDEMLFYCQDVERRLCVDLLMLGEWCARGCWEVWTSHT